MNAGNRSKIADLRDLGFADPVKMITSSPEIARPNKRQRPP